MDKHELQNRVYDLEMHLKMSRDCSGELRTEIEQLRHECAEWQEANRCQFDLLVQAEAERDMFKSALEEIVGNGWPLEMRGIAIRALSKRPTCSLGLDPHEDCRDTPCNSCTAHEEEDRP